MKETKKALLTIAKIGSKVDASLMDDGKISVTEGIAIGMSALGLIGVFKNIAEIKEELKGFNEVTKVELVEAFKKEFDLTNDEAEAKVESGVEVLLTLYLYLKGSQPTEEVAEDFQ